MDTILVTGGAGFLGSHIAEHLTQSGHHVVVIDDLSGGYVRNIPANAEFHQMSTCDRAAVERLFQKYRFRYVFHCAAYAAEGLSHHIRHFNYSNNILGTMPLINSSILHGVECFVYTSSIAVYGVGAPPFREESILRPIDPYGIAKLTIEYDLQAAYRYFGLPYIIFRPHNIYGERQNLADPYRNVIGIFMRQIRDGKACTVFGDGSQHRAFSYIADVAPVIAQSTEVPAARNRIFNIGADEVCTVLQLAGMVQRAMGQETGISFQTGRNEVHTAFCDHTLVKKILGYSGQTRLEDGIGRMAAWAKTIQISSSPSLPEIEVAHAMPAAWENTSTLP